MPRIARVVAVGVPHPITQRGNHRAVTFFSDADRELYLELLTEYFQLHHVDLLGYCLMSNHVHLIAVPHRADSLARGIGRAHNAFSRWMNIRRHQTGHFFQARFDSTPMDSAYTWRALLYTELNPVRAGMVRRARDYPWSSARIHCGQAACPAWLTLDPWEKAYQPAEWEEILEVGFREHGQLERLREGLRSGRPLGDEAFIDELETRLGRPLRRQKPGRRPKETTDEEAEETGAEKQETKSAQG